MKSHLRHELKIGEEAAQWLLRLEQDRTSATRSAFVAWLKHSPQHLQELLATDAALHSLDTVDPQRRLDVSKLLRQGTAEILPLQESPDIESCPVEQTRHTRHRRARWAAAIAAGVMILAGAAYFLPSLPAGDQEYATTVGEQRSWRLQDGSVVYLNTRSRLQVRYSAQARDLRLLDGEALFVVAADPARPFRVDAGSATIQAVGTQFNIHRDGDSSTVAVIEGRVKVSIDAGSETATPLARGEQARITARRIAKQTTSQGDSPVAWRNRQLVFTSQTLEEVVKEVNRYNRVQLRIADTALASRRLSGVFNVDDLPSLLAFLERDGELTSTYEQDGKLITLRVNSMAR